MKTRFSVKIFTFGYYNNTYTTCEKHFAGIMTNDTTTCILNVILLIILLAIATFHATRRNEYFDASVAPCTHGAAPPTSVYSSFPPQQQYNMAWKYLTPFQNTCLGTTACAPNTCTSGQRFVCSLTPHNQRVCRWI